MPTYKANTKYKKYNIQSLRQIQKAQITKSEYKDKHKSRSQRQSQHTNGTIQKTKPILPNTKAKSQSDKGKDKYNNQNQKSNTKTKSNAKTKHKIHNTQKQRINTSQSNAKYKIQ